MSYFHTMHTQMLDRRMKWPEYPSQADVILEAAGRTKHPELFLKQLSTDMRHLACVRHIAHTLLRRALPPKTMA